MNYKNLLKSAAVFTSSRKLVILLLALILLIAPVHAQNGITRIRHVVVIFQENRTPDNLFHDPKLIAAGADIASFGWNSKGKKIKLSAVPLSFTYDLDHSHAAFVAMYDQGRMDGADQVKVFCHMANCPTPNMQFRYVKPADVAPYFQLAEQYTFADRMFQTNQGPSFPAHQFIISGTSAPTADSDLFAAENPNRAVYLSNTGCLAPAQETVALIDPLGNETTYQYPCFEHATLTDLLDDRGISWRYYTPSAGSIWTGPNAISHMRLGPDWKNVILQPNQVLSDIKRGKLPKVSWVMPSGPESDHAVMNKGLGPSWVASIVNAIGGSKYWSDAAIFITWDDWGGWYDHVPPTIRNSYEDGFRVPLIVVSPYAKAGYISHAKHDFGSILKFTEEVFGLPSLGYADSQADDLSDCFDFNRRHAFRKISAPRDAEYFLNDRTPLVGPDDD
jgi:phospholipase C